RLANTFGEKLMAQANEAAPIVIRHLLTKTFINPSYNINTEAGVRPSDQKPQRGYIQGTVMQWSLLSQTLQPDPLQATTWHGQRSTVLAVFSANAFDAKANEHASKAEPSVIKY